MLCCLYTEYLPSVAAGTQHLLAKESKFVRYNPEILEWLNVQRERCTIRELVLLRFPSGNPRPLQAGFPHPKALEAESQTLLFIIRYSVVQPVGGANY